MRYWLFKTEPTCFSIDDLAASPAQTTSWSGVRNFQARNFLRDEVRLGDNILFYHSNVDPVGIAGICEVVKAGYPDVTALDPNDKHFDPKATRDNPIWYTVDVKFSAKLSRVVPLALLKKTPGLEKMEVCRRGSRLSVQPVTPQEWRIVQRVLREYW